MFSLLARLRALALASLIFSYVSARDESLFTSSVTYCEAPDSLLIQHFDVAYIAHNQSLFFNISAASVDENVNVTANILLNVYGMTPANLTIDLCNILGGALCPLPQYNFTGSDYLSLPESLGFANYVPGIAYKIPDLEGFAQLSLIEVGTGTVRACVQATLSNGWSAHQPAVEWTTRAVSLFALLIAAWQSWASESILAFRLLDLIHLYQAISSTALLNLNYPSVYRSFTLNFAWAMGLISSSHSTLQDSIDIMRHRTGGHMANSSSGSAVGLVNRKLSPYNTLRQNTILPQSLLSYPMDNVTRIVVTNSTNRDTLKILSSTENDVQTVTSASSNVLQAGIPIYVNSINVGTANAFMTVFIVTLILTAFALGVIGCAYGAYFVAERFQWSRPNKRLSMKERFLSFLKSWGTRLILIVLFPTTVFAFYQWTLKDSWLSTLFSVLIFSAIVGFIGSSSYSVFTFCRTSPSPSLHANPSHLSWFGPLFARYRAPRYYFFMIPLASVLLKAIFIAFAKRSGLAQVILILIVEAANLGASIILRPHPTRGGDVFSAFLAVTRLVCSGLMIAFTEGLKVDAIPRVAIGIVTAVIFSIAIIVVHINMLLHVGLDRLFRRDRQEQSSSDLTDSSMLEKGDASSVYIRPSNPTPTRNIPLGAGNNHSLVSTSSSTVGQPNTYNRDSASTTFGSVLPRRWSFTPLSSPSQSTTTWGDTPPSPPAPIHLI